MAGFRTMTKKNIDQKLPISMENITHIIDRVAARYSAIDKAQVAIIVRSFFKMLRKILFTGDSISFRGIFTNMKLHYFSRQRKEKLRHYVKVKLGTSDKIKYGK